MKKIIYSLVIMIAAGSLFTSCIEQVEPLGIQDMRFAKAEYIRALKDLRAADAELVRAEAAHELARARYVDAMTANLNADTEYQQLLNEYQQLINEARQDTNDVIAQETANRIDSIKKRMELRELEHQKNMVAAQDSLANAQERLRVALRNIALYSQSLTPDEQAALATAVYMYTKAFEETAKQDIKVLKLQYKLDSLKAAAAVGDTVYDKSSKAYIGQVNKWKKDIEANETKQAILAAILLAVPDSLNYEDLNGWKEQIDQMVADSTAAEYERYQTKIEMSQYYTANIYDGVEAFNNAVAVFGAENDLYTDAVPDRFDPTTWDNVPDSLNKKQKEFIAAGEPKQDDFKQSMDTIIVFPDLLDSDFNLYPYYYYYATLLSSYNQESPVSKATSDNEIIVWKGAAVDTIRIQKANQSMKAFILGADGDGDDAEVYTWEDEEGVEHEIKANYGLKGALSVLKRIYEEEKAALDPVETAKAKKIADSVWTAHNGILKAGLTAYEPFTTAKTNYETVKNASKPDAMFSAMKELYAQIKTIDEQKDINAVDSSAILAAIEKFAKARDAYLDDANNNPKNKYADDKNPHFFYFATKTDGGKPVVDSVSFTEIATQTKFDKAAYQWDTEAKDNAKEGTNYMSNVKAEEKGRRAALNNILSQLFGVNMTASFNKNDATPMPLGVGSTIMSDAQKILPGSDPEYYVTTTWDKAAALTNASYEPKAVTTAAEKVYEAIGKYYGVYNSYWNPTTALPTAKADVEALIGTSWAGYFADPKATTLATALTATFAEFDSDLMNHYSSTTKKGDLKADTYTATPFDAFTKDEAPLVLFANNTDIIPTDAIDVVLDALDPKGWTIGDDPNTSAIFNFNGTKGTDFYNRMKARYNDWLANHPEKDFEQDTKTIEKWISAVEHAFALDAEKAGMPDTDAYEKAVKKYNRLTKQDAAYKAFVEALHEFAGEDAEDQDDIVTLTAPSVTIPGEEFATIASVEIPELLETNILGTYTGEWAEGLGGTQLELAKTLFPDYPENILEWDAEMEYADDITEEYGILIDAAKAAYLAAAKVAGENVGDATSFDQLIENYKEANKNYRKRILDKIEALQTEIDQWEQNLAKWQVGAPAREIEIAEAANALKVESARLKGYEEALAYAKANLDHLLEYIKSLDVNFVVPAVDLDD